MPALSVKEVFTSAESLLLSNSTVAFSIGDFCSLKMVTDILPFCCAYTKAVDKTHNTIKVKFFISETICASKHRIKMRMK